MSAADAKLLRSLAKPVAADVRPLAPVSDLMTVAEAAAYLRVSEAFVYDHAVDAKGRSRRGDPRIPTVRLGGALRFRRASLDAMLAKMEAKTA